MPQCRPATPHCRRALNHTLTMMKTLRHILLAALLLAAAAPAGAAAASPQPPAAVESQATVSAGRLVLKALGDEAVTFQVYSITGQLVARAEVLPGVPATLELPRGYYIVKTATWSRQVVVK